MVIKKIDKMLYRGYGQNKKVIKRVLIIETQDDLKQERWQACEFDKIIVRPGIEVSDKNRQLLLSRTFLRGDIGQLIIQGDENE